MKKYTLLLFVISIFILQAHGQGLLLNGKWKYNFADKKNYSDADFDDKAWKEISGKLSWTMAELPKESPIVWLRKTVVIPSSLKKELNKTGALAFFIGQTDQTYDAFFNGKLIGTTKSGDTRKGYLVNPAQIKWDEENTFAIRMKHWWSYNTLEGMPEFGAAPPAQMFVFTVGAKGITNKQQVSNKEITFTCTVQNKSEKAVDGIIKADFFDLDHVKLSSLEKKVKLNSGSNTVDFVFKSTSPFLKIEYAVVVPEYQYTGLWNDEYGYKNIPYHVAFPVIANKVGEEFKPAALNNQKLTGWLGDKMKVNIEKRLYRIDEDKILGSFINRPGNHPWIGEHIGKFLEAACNSYENTMDPALKIQIDRSAQKLIAAQLSDGYLGTYAMDNHWTGWDVWSHKYDLIGLLKYYEISGFKPALKAADKIGDLLCQKFGTAKGQKNILNAGGHVGMAATCILDPMTDLYRFTGNKKYLDFCYYIIKSFDEPKGPRIISTLGTLGRVDKTANGKAYEMLSNLVGVIKLYKITGDTYYLTPILNAWKDIVANRLYITGTSSSKEHFMDNHLLPAETEDNMGEGCVTTTWVQLNYQLFCLTGKIEYLNELERSVYNHLIGAQDPHTGFVSYYTPLMGKKACIDYQSCCASSVPRGIAMIPLFANGKIKGAPSFFLYQPGVFKTNLDNKEKTSVEFTTQTQFPTNGKVSIVVNPAIARQFAVQLRKPYWADDFTVWVNNKKHKTTSTDFATLDRVWKKGDKIDITFNIATKVLSGSISYPGKIAIQRGPQVLVVDNMLNQKASADILLNGKQIKLNAVSSVLPADWAGNQAYEVLGAANGKEQKLILVPFADAGQTGGTITTWLSDRSKMK